MDIYIFESILHRSVRLTSCNMSKARNGDGSIFRWFTILSGIFISIGTSGEIEWKRAKKTWKFLSKKIESMTQCPNGSASHFSIQMARNLFDCTISQMTHYTCMRFCWYKFTNSHGTCYANMLAVTTFHFHSSEFSALYFKLCYWYL